MLAGRGDDERSRQIAEAAAEFDEAFALLVDRTRAKLGSEPEAVLAAVRENRESDAAMLAALVALGGTERAGDLLAAAARDHAGSERRAWRDECRSAVIAASNQTLAPRPAHQAN
ncbi:MAG: hypothetical protein JSS20_10340 [Proteobacteria bacterium]|nr:hypothetical protein [Pseudomonadota bacterium]